MNIFRLLGDLSHVLAVLLLLRKIWNSKSAEGLSLRSQILFSIVYITRYLDVFTTFISLYNTVMKLLFVGISCMTVYLIHTRFRATYDSHKDTFRMELALAPCFFLALFFNYEFSVVEVLWAFSIYLEAVAIAPQLFMIMKRHKAEMITGHYLFALGSYRALYILNWIYRYYVESHFDPIAVYAGLVQTALYCDFFLLYITHVLAGSGHDIEC